jgi:cytosine/adenosine deaminase-related metal-dependent hydrolase
MIDGGTTTVADFAHVNYSTENNYSAVSATISSGIRSVYGYCLNPRLSSVNPFTIDNNSFGGHGLSAFEELASLIPATGDGRVRLGLAFDAFPYTPKEYVDMLMSKVNEYKIDLIQSHISWKPGKPSAPQAIEKLGVLDNRFLMAHSNMSKEDAELYRKRGVHYSSTPSTELQMALAFPVMAFRDDLEVKDLGSLGVDCHANNSAFIPGEARLGLQSARAHRCEVS